MARPFIPPPPEMLNRSPAAPTQPVIPEPPPGHSRPEWASQPLHAGNFPIYPSSPYAPGFIPPSPDMYASHGRAIMNPPPPTLYTEYLAPNPAAQGPWSAPGHAAAGHSGWPGIAPPQRSAGAPPPFYPPNPATMFPGQPSPYPPHQGAWPMSAPMPYYGAAGAGWNTGPVVPGPLPPHQTPMGYGFLTFDPHTNTPAWPAHQMAQPQQYQNPSHARTDRFGDRMDKLDPFMAGPDYGPVLEPFICGLLRIPIKINPLLEPLADIEDKPHLKWNMLYQSNDCFRSTDERHLSWTKGRDEPATYPRVTEIRIVSETLPWTSIVTAQNKAIGVTCGEVIESLAASLHLIAPGTDFNALDHKKQAEVGTAYRYNRSREPGVPGGSLGEGLRRLDFLGKDVIFGGICRDDTKIHQMYGNAVLPCTFLLKCLRQYAVTSQEARDHDDRQRAHEEKLRAEREEARTREDEKRRRPTVEDEFDEE